MLYFKLNQQRYQLWLSANTSTVVGHLLNIFDIKKSLLIEQDVYMYINSYLSQL